MGVDSHVISIVAPGKPDSPDDLHVVATAADSVTLGWRPGFDGGHNQTYIVTVLFQKTGDLVFEKTLESHGRAKVNRTTVVDLEPATSYIIRVRSKNRAGVSEAAEEVFVKTRCEFNFFDSEHRGLGVRNVVILSSLLFYCFEFCLTYFLLMSLLLLLFVLLQMFLLLPLTSVVGF